MKLTILWEMVWECMGKNIGFEVISWDLRPLNMGKNQGDYEITKRNGD